MVGAPPWGGLLYDRLPSGRTRAGAHAQRAGRSGRYRRMLPARALVAGVLVSVFLVPASAAVAQESSTTTSSSTSTTTPLDTSTSAPSGTTSSDAPTSTTPKPDPDAFAALA